MRSEPSAGDCDLRGREEFAQTLNTEVEGADPALSPTTARELLSDGNDVMAATT
jgi:hypothetical protein